MVYELNIEFIVVHTEVFREPFGGGEKKDGRNYIFGSTVVIEVENDKDSVRY